jgi:hypothetical protein
MTQEFEQPWVLFVSPKRALSVGPGPLGYFADHFVGRPMGRDWTAPTCEVSGRTRRPRDFLSWVPSAPVISERAKQAIESVSGVNVEILPLLELSGSKFYALNVLDETDALDRERSKLTLFRDSGAILSIEGAVFKFKLGQVPPIFKIRGYGGVIFVSTLFAQAVRNARLTGAIFLDPAKDIFKRIVRDEIHDDFQQPADTTSS